MSYRDGKKFVIAPEPASVCEVCGEHKELRPYGPGGQRLCFHCAMSTPEMRRTVKKNFGKLLDGESHDDD